MKPFTSAKVVLECMKSFFKGLGISVGNGIVRLLSLIICAVLLVHFTIRIVKRVYGQYKLKNVCYLEYKMLLIFIWMFYIFQHGKVA